MSLKTVLLSRVEAYLSLLLGIIIFFIVVTTLLFFVFGAVKISRL